MEKKLALTVYQRYWLDSMLGRQHANVHQLRKLSRICDALELKPDVAKEIQLVENPNAGYRWNDEKAQALGAIEVSLDPNDVAYLIEYVRKALSESAANGERIFQVAAADKVIELLSTLGLDDLLDEPEPKQKTNGEK